MSSRRDGMTAGILGEPLRVINRLVADGLLLDCAICGGVAALYYTEPVLTYDFDVLCRFPASTALIDPTPLYARLKEWGYSFGFEDRVTIADIPVQFIAAAPGLMEEALYQAVPVTICGVGTRVLRAEYLAAIMLDLYRPKDRAKLSLLVDNDAVVFDGALFAALLKRYGLEAKWRRCHEE